MAASTYRIEHRSNTGDPQVLGYSDDPIARIAALEPYAHDLLDRQVGGELFLVEQASGEVVCHRPIWIPGAQESWDIGADGSWYN